MHRRLLPHFFHGKPLLRLRFYLLSLSLSLVLGNSIVTGNEILSPDAVPFFDFPRQRKAATILSPQGWMQQKALQESSGLVLSTLAKNVLWSCNDSGHAPTLYPIQTDGSIPEGGEEGCQIEGVENVDWEALCHDDQGHFIIGDTGNNANRRRELQLYWIKEPQISSRTASVVRTLRYIYPDQKEFPPPNRDYDCEAIAMIGSTLQLITKNRGNSRASVYQIDTNAENPAIVKKAIINLRKQVTGASVSPQQKQIAVLTYQGIWLFDIPEQRPQEWWTGTAYHLPIIAMQCEAIAYLNENTLIVTNEQGSVFQIDTGEILPIK